MYCSTCKKFICPNCIINHSSNEDHFSININRYDSLCIKHSYLFYSYYVDCKKICVLIVWNYMMKNIKE